MDDHLRDKDDLIGELTQLRRENPELESGWAAEICRRQECERQLLAQEGLAETAERLLKQREEESLELINSFTEGAWIVDRVAGTIKCSEKWAKRIGLDLVPEEERLPYVHTLSHPDDTAGCNSILYYMETKATSYNLEYRIKTVDCGYIWTQNRGKIVYNEQGQAVKVSGATFDITERKQAEDKRAKAEAELKKTLDLLEEKVAERTRQLAHERQRLLDVLETLPVNICLLTPDYEVRFANRAFRERFGESNGRHCYDYIFGYDKPCAGCRSFTPLETGQSLHWIFSAPDGSILDAYDYPFVDVDGSSLILEMNMDITEQKRLEAEMARLDRLNLIGEMAASIGHEIRNPMTAVRGFLQMLGSKPEYQGDSDYFELMIEELDRANAIITEYLGMARDKRVELHTRCLNSIITTISPVIQSDANLREMKLEFELSDIPQPLIDESEIRQMILNMARNGMEAMSMGSKLTIGTRPEANQVVLYIKDEGHGVNQDLMERLGTPFLTTKENGTGLGLPVCYSIAARHNARIDCETGPEGTTFYVRFPVPEQMRGIAG